MFKYKLEILRHRAANFRLKIVATMLIISIEVMLKLVGFQRVIGILSRISNCQSNLPRRSPEIISSIITRYTKHVEQASKMKGVSGRCLSKSITLNYLLKRKGIQTSINFGHNLDPDLGFKAHAWLEYKGLVINDVASIGTQYKPFNHVMGDKYSPSSKV
jgi:hypothetical protein